MSGDPRCYKRVAHARTFCDRSGTRFGFSKKNATAVRFGEYGDATLFGGEYVLAVHIHFGNRGPQRVNALGESKRAFPRRQYSDHDPVG